MYLKLPSKRHDVKTSVRSILVVVMDVKKWQVVEKTVFDRYQWSCPHKLFPDLELWWDISDWLWVTCVLVTLWIRNKTDWYRCGNYMETNRYLINGMESKTTFMFKLYHLKLDFKWAIHKWRNFCDLLSALQYFLHYYCLVLETLLSLFGISIGYVRKLRIGELFRKVMIRKCI